MGAQLAPETEARSRYQVTFIVLAVAVAGYALLQSLVVPVLPTIQAELHTSQNMVTWVLTAYLLSASIFTPIMGRLGDMFGKKRFLVITLLALTVGTLLAALAGSITILIVARVIQGIGGGVLPLAFGIVRDEFPGHKVTGAVGVIAALAAVGAGLGIVLAGPIVAVLDYHWLFWFPMIVLGATAVAAFVVVPESVVRTAGKIDWLAAALLSAWLVALILGISQGPSWGWLSASVLGLIAAGLVIAVLWVWVEARSDHPLIDMKMMRIPTVWTTNLVALLFGVAMYAVLAFLPEFLQTPSSAGYGFGASVTRSGLIVLPLSLVMFVFGLLSGRLSQRYSARLVLLAGALITAAGLVFLTFLHSQEWVILLETGLVGGGFGLAFAAMSSLVVEAVPPDQTGVASGMNANIRTIGGSLGAAVMSSIVTASAHNGGLPTEAGYTWGFAFLALSALGAAAASLAVPRVRGRRTARVTQDPMLHAELALVAGGTLAGDESE